MNNKDNLSIAKRYAKSLIGIMTDNKQDNGQIKKGVENVKTILQSSPELYSVITNPIVSITDKKEIINSVFERDTNETVQNFLKLLVEENRFNLIYSIVDAFNEMADKLDNIVKVTVTSAIELTEEKKQEIENKIKEKLNKNIQINYILNPSIIAGLIYQTEDRVLDTSFLHKIEKLKQELIK